MKKTEFLKKLKNYTLKELIEEIRLLKKKIFLKSSESNLLKVREKELVKGTKKNLKKDLARALTILNLKKNGAL